MSILHGLVAHETTIIAEYKSNNDMDDLMIVQAILKKIPPNNSKLTYVYDRYLFHYISENGITWMCMANESFGRHIPFVFLKDIQAKLLEKYTAAQILNTPPYGIQSSFSKTIQQQMEYYNNSDGDNKLKRVQHEIDQVKDVMSHNIDRVLERGDRIDILVDKTHGLSQQAFAFKKRSTLLKRSMWWKNTKIVSMILIVIMVTRQLARRTFLIIISPLFFFIPALLIHS